MIKHENKVLKEIYYEETLDNGLKVFLMPKNDYYKTYAVFATKYGSRDTEFIPLGQDDFIKTPEGIAHFLEHKLFENENGIDVSNLFAEYGGDVNAFTTNDQTSYVFSTTTEFEKNLELLLDFVQNPYFTKQGVEKERGIIEQELLMYLDQPQNVQYFGILKGLYNKNHIRNEIGGTVDSIKEIDEDLLYTCYNTFYHPSNMVLTIVGKFDLDNILDLIKQNQNKKVFDKPSKIERKYFIESEEVNQKNSFQDMNINSIKVSIGLKISCEQLNSKEYVKKALMIDMITDLYLNEASNQYEQLLEEGIINNSFDYGAYFDRTYGHILINLDTEKPDLFLEKLTQIIDKINKDEITIEEFNRIKKLHLARYIRHFNSVEYLANTLAETYFDGLTLFDEFDVLNDIKLEDLLDARKYFNKNNLATFIIYPINN